ncbi:CTP synthase [Patescibacteria group bacterium]|nr:CTP synthase [Patescibacteria group bacterium]
MPKYIFIVGGVMSGIGKGVATASIGSILKSKGFKITAIKIDPYINVDAGTMNPIEHGEVFVTNDGAECDQDLGNYERFLDQDLITDNYITTGKIYQAVIEKERNLEYKGKCVEVVPHIPEEVISRIQKVVKKTKTDFVLIEIGGTVGEYQNLLFLEAARILKLRHPKDVLFVLVSYLPIPAMIGEMKTKPTQYAVRSLNMAGIQPDIILARAQFPLDIPRKKKISIFCNVKELDIVSAPDIKSIYEIPVNFEKENLGNRILKKFGLRARKKDLKDWKKLVTVIKNPQKEINIGVVGKYFKSGDFTLMDSYISVIEAIKHASYFFKAEPKISWLDAEKYENSPQKLKELKKFNGIIVPGGFGSRGVEGKIKVIEFCRTQKIPFLGLCLGMQLAVIEFARNVCGIKKAISREFFNKKTKEGSCQYQMVIDVMLDQKEKLNKKNYGGTMRLGAYDCKLMPNTISHRAYGASLISERHRHRYELNSEFQQILEKKGLIMAGINPERNLVEIVEIKKHPFFIGTQFHPEFKSKPLRPHPLFKEFIKAGLKFPHFHKILNYEMQDLKRPDLSKTE